MVALARDDFPKTGGYPAVDMIRPVRSAGSVPERHFDLHFGSIARAPARRLPARVGAGGGALMAPMVSHAYRYSASAQPAHEPVSGTGNRLRRYGRRFRDPGATRGFPLMEPAEPAARAGKRTGRRSSRGEIRALSRIHLFPSRLPG